MAEPASRGAAVHQIRPLMLRRRAANTVAVQNIDQRTVAGFDDVWRTFSGAGEGPSSDEPFETYFAIFPVEMLAGAEGFELGSGNGRIARSVAARAGLLHCIEPTAGGIAASKMA